MLALASRSSTQWQLSGAVSSLKFRRVYFYQSGLSLLARRQVKSRGWIWRSQANGAFSRATCVFRRRLPWVRRELRLRGSPHGSANEGPRRQKLRAWLWAPAPSSRRVRQPRRVPRRHVVRPRPPEDERRPHLQYLLPLWQRGAGEWVTAGLS